MTMRAVCELRNGKTVVDHDFEQTGVAICRRCKLVLKHNLTSYLLVYHQKTIMVFPFDYV